MLREFLHAETSGSLVLIACTLAALAWANSPWHAAYHDLTHATFGLRLGGASFELSLQHWINDGLMALFFFVVGLEVKRELQVGELSSRRKAALPVSAALGGMLVPALLYAALNVGGEGAAGWGVPMATDIAFALGILALLGSRAPVALKVFLTALAIADDLGAIVVIALFYTESIRLPALGGAAALLVVLWLVARSGVRVVWAYVLLAIGVWACVLASGLHATLAGIAVAMLVPVRSKLDPGEFFARTRRRIDELEASELTQESMVHRAHEMEALDDLYLTAERMRPPGLALEHLLHPVQAFFVLPLFAFFNAGVRLDGEVLGQVAHPVSLGILLGLFVGKPVGVMLFSWLAVKSGQAALPDRVRWSHLAGIGCLAGVGFTMSIFISGLAFAEPLHASLSKVAILGASLLSGVLGFLVLRRTLPPRAEAS
ncbi:MAG: Na+/H+ antiporter NhaA [Planctomycetes bacterium]|nr:Na+/H+ antiporter NhaA [Planctomycetota bacterium]